MATAVPVPDQFKPSFVIFDIRALWASDCPLPRCQKLPMMVSWLLFCLSFVTVCWYVFGAGHTDTYSCYGPSSIIKYQGSYSSQGSAADTASLATPSSSVAVSQSFWSRPVGYARSVSVSLHICIFRQFVLYVVLSTVPWIKCIFQLFLAVHTMLPYTFLNESQNLRQNLAWKVGGELSPGHRIKKFLPAAKILNFHIQCHRTTLFTTTTTGIMVTFCIQYKSSKATYDLHTGQWF